MKLLYATLLIFAMVSSVLGADPVGKVEATLSAEGDLWVGQRVPLSIKIFAPGFSINGVPTFDLPEISGLIVLKLSGPPTIGNETINELTYVTQRHEFALFPQRAGEFTVPSFPVRFASSSGYGKPVTPFTVKTDPLTFTAQFPPGAEGLRTLISTKRLIWQESWSPDVRSVKVGDAVTRTITLKADDIPGMEFPPLTFEPIAGVGVYPKPPSVTDISNRGSLTGERVESVTYVFEQSGTYTLLGFSLAWWKLDENALKRETIESRTISVDAPVHSEKTAKSTSSDIQNSPWIWTTGLAAIFGAAAVAMMLFLRRQPERIDEEAALFTSLKAACRTNDRRRILAALTTWLDHRRTSSEPVLITSWAAQSGDEELVHLIDRLETDLFQQTANNPHAPFPGHVLLAHVRRLRHRLDHRRSTHKKETSLSPLNPS
ncbi:MAG TPA: BatD family protein [Planctomicrobium sp.]|nr:BatD family protein [Planctomicrobium sp.]